jgi:hypothetical protein
MTFGIAALGIIVILVAYLIAVMNFKDAENPGEPIPAIVGAVTTAIGTLAGLVAGHTAGASGKEQADQRVDKAQGRYSALSEVASPDTVAQAMANHPSLFQA